MLKITSHPPPPHTRTHLPPHWLKTGLSCHHSFNNNKRYYVTSSIEKDVDQCRCKSIQSMKQHYFYSHQKPTKLVYEICLIPIVLWGSWKTSSWFLLYIGSAQLIRRPVKIDQLWICFSFWWNIFNNRLTAVRIDICYSLSWCLYWESFIAFNFIYISNKT